MRFPAFLARIVAAGALLLASAAPVHSAEPGRPASAPTLLPPPAVPAEEAFRPPPVPEVTRLGQGIYRIGEIRIDKNERSLSLPAEVNQRQGLLEYLLVRIGGKTHESLLRTKVEPYHLQVAFLLLGLAPTDKPLAFQGDPERPRGKPVQIFISYRDAAGREMRVKAEEWVARKSGETVQPAGRLEWVYTGSAVVNGRLIAQNEGSIIATYHDPVALVDNASAGGESDKVWLPLASRLPPVGTPVTVTVVGGE